MHLGAINARVLALSLAACLLTGPAAAGDAAVENRLEASIARLELGETAPGEAVEGVVTLRNVGRRAIGIVEATTTCNCTVASVEPRVVEPGGEIRVTVTMAPPDRAATETTAELRVTTTEGQQIRVPVSLRTAASLTATVGKIALHPDGSAVCEATISASDGRPFTILGVAAQSGGAEAVSDSHKVLARVGDGLRALSLIHI